MKWGTHRKPWAVSFFAMLITLLISLALAQLVTDDPATLAHSAAGTVAPIVQDAGGYTLNRVDGPRSEANTLSAQPDKSGPIAGAEIAVLSLLGIGLIVLSLVNTAGRH